jgi:hypothetical protein
VSRCGLSFGPDPAHLGIGPHVAQRVVELPIVLDVGAGGIPDHAIARELAVPIVVLSFRDGEALEAVNHLARPSLGISSVSTDSLSCMKPGSGSKGS